MGRQLQETKEELEKVQEEKMIMEGKVVKYKEEVLELRKGLKQSVENENTLTAELKKEMKLKEEKEMKVKKGEEKLKKKERQLDDELATRERTEKEVGEP